MIPKLNIISTLAAVVLFCLPWINMKCTGATVGTQNGIQVIYGGQSTPNVYMKVSGWLRQETKDTDIDKIIGPSDLVLVCFLAAIGALTASILRFIREEKFPKYLTPVFSAVAIVSLTVQMVVGFPVEGAMIRVVNKESKRLEGRLNFQGGTPAMYKTEYTVALWLELLALSIPVLMAAEMVISHGSERKATR